jgi:hypothetical protein
VDQWDGQNVAQSDEWEHVVTAMPTRAALGLALALLASSACRRDHRDGGAEASGGVETVPLGEVRVGRETARFYVAYGVDAAILGFSVSAGAEPARYFPMFASTHRGIPPVVLEVFASKSDTEMWVRSSWPDNAILAYRRVGAETALTQWGETRFFTSPMPDRLSGGAVPFPDLIVGNVVRKATLDHGR